MASRQSPADELLSAAQSDPDAVDAGAIEEQFDAERASDRSVALQAASVIAETDPERVAPLSDRIVELLDDEVLAVRSAAALTLLSLARARPEAVVPAIPALVAVLDEDPPLFRFRAAGALAPLTESHPEAFVDHLDRLVELLVDGPTFDDDPAAVARSDELTPQQKQRRLSTLEGRGDEVRRGKVRSRGAREVVANVLVEVARVEPDACAAALPEIVPALSEDDPAVRGATVEIVRRVAEHDPDAVGEAVEPLVELLDDDVEFVRARAVRALGYAEATEAIEPLRERARAESADAVAELAEDTADWLAEEAA